MEKKRSTNFSTFETHLLIKLVEDQKHVLDPQKLNATSLNMKHGAWREITSDFNNNNHIKAHRDEKALKKKYSNLKCDAKNWPTLRAEALAKLSDLQSCPTSSQKKKADKAAKAAIIKADPTTQDNGHSTHSNDAQLQQNDDVQTPKLESTEVEAEGEDSNRQRKRLQYLDKDSEKFLEEINEKRIKLTEEESKLKMELLETEHREQLRFLKLKHEMAMKTFQLEQERLKVEMDFIKKEADLRMKRQERFLEQKNSKKI